MRTVADPRVGAIAAWLRALEAKEAAEVGEKVWASFSEAEREARLVLRARQERRRA